MYKEWEYIHNPNIVAIQEYDYINKVSILDESDGGRRVMLSDVTLRDITPDCWRRRVRDNKSK